MGYAEYLESLWTEEKEKSSEEIDDEMCELADRLYDEQWEDQCQN